VLLHLLVALGMLGDISGVRYMQNEKFCSTRDGGRETVRSFWLDIGAGLKKLLAGKPSHF